jgi:hypothetical protein
MGLLLAVVVHPADVADRNGARLLLAGLAKVWVDAATRAPVRPGSPRR